MIKTNRLLLRPFEKGDASFLFTLNNDPLVNQYRSTKTASLESCKQDIETWQQRYGQGLLNVYLMALEEVNTPIGLIAIFKRSQEDMAELGYRMLPDYWGCGYCHEATEGLVKAYFEASEAGEIFAETHPDNKHSIHFLMNNKFHEDHHEMENRGRIFITRRALWL